MHKSNFKFEELTPMTGVKPYVLRYWETEFPEIQSSTMENGTRLYSQQDLDIILEIKELLFEKKMTIAAAKGFIFNKYSKSEQVDSKVNLPEESFSEKTQAPRVDSEVEFGHPHDQNLEVSPVNVGDNQNSFMKPAMKNELSLQSIAYLQAISKTLKKIDEIKMIKGWKSTPQDQLSTED